MKKKMYLFAATVMGCSILLAGCGLCDVDMNSSSSSHHETAAEASKRKVSASHAAKKAAANAKSESIEVQGKQYRYGLPLGPSWLQVYEKNHATGVYLSPTKSNVVKMHEGNDFFLSGKLPWVGRLSTKANPIATRSTAATMDQEDAFDYSLDSGSYGMQQTFTTLAGGDAKTVSSHAFADLKQFYKARNDLNPDELPNDSEELQSIWDASGVDPSSGELTTRYDVEAQYFELASMKVDPSSDQVDKATRVEIDSHYDNDGKEIYPTKLYVQTFVKMKTTDLQKQEMLGQSNDNYGKSHTAIIHFQVIYQLTDKQTWELVDVDEGEESDYDLDTSKEKWITEE